MTNTANTNLRIPRLRNDQVLLYETPNGYRGHVALGDEIWRITLTKMPTSRLIVYEIVATDNGAAITGTVFESEQPGGLGKTGKPLPDLRGQITIAGPDEDTFEFAVWRRTAASGQTYYGGLIQPARDNGAKEPSMPGTERAALPSRDNIVALQGQSAP